MGVDVNYRTINYSNQAEFDYFFATAFDRYDRNRDGVIDYREFQPLINDMCQMITQRYGYGPTVDKIRAAWSSLDFNRSGYITRNEFSTRARYELERILTQPDYMPAGYRQECMELNHMEVDMDQDMYHHLLHQHILEVMDQDIIQDIHNQDMVLIHQDIKA